MTSPHRITIRAGLDGARTELKLDGRPVQVLGFKAEGGPNVPTRVTLTILADVTIDGVAETFREPPLIARAPS